MRNAHIGKLLTPPSYQLLRQQTLLNAICWDNPRIHRVEGDHAASKVAQVQRGQ